MIGFRVQSYEIIHHFSPYFILFSYLCKKINGRMRHTPIYIIEEQRLRRNLSLIASVAREADVEIILAFKAFA